MDDTNITPTLTDEGYSPEAIANLERALEEFAESLLAIKSEDANIKVFESLQITMNGRKRRMGDIGNVESPYLLKIYSSSSLLG